MGTLKSFNLADFIEKYNTKIFIETGTFQGDGILYADKFNFEQLHSIEMVEDFYEKTKLRLSNKPYINLINANSVDGLEKILTSLSSYSNVFFWLDAHLPNYYKSEYGNDYINNKKILIPLEEELIVIKKNRNIKNDVFIIDDLRIYEKGNYESGNWLNVIDHNLYDGITFINNLLGETHNITKDYRHEGYIICVPK